jgi:hypothetical protein
MQVTGVDSSEVGEVKERTESRCVRVINRAACVLIFGFEFLLENRPPWLRFVVPA